MKTLREDAILKESARLRIEYKDSAIDVCVELVDILAPHYDQRYYGIYDLYMDVLECLVKKEL